MLPVVEALPRDEDFFDFEARYAIGRTEYVCPARIGDELTARAQSIALEVWRLFGCEGFGRVDLMLDEATGELYVLETNTIPGLTETSLLPQAAEADGLAFDALIAKRISWRGSAGAGLRRSRRRRSPRVRPGRGTP